MLAPVPLREMTRRHRRPRTARDQRTPSGPGNPTGVIPVENDRSRGFQIPSLSRLDENIEGVLPKNWAFSEPTVAPRLFPLRFALRMRVIMRKHFPTTVSKGWKHAEDGTPQFSASRLAAAFRPAPTLSFVPPFDRPAPSDPPNSEPIRSQAVRCVLSRPRRHVCTCTPPSTPPSPPVLRFGACPWRTLGLRSVPTVPCHVPNSSVLHRRFVPAKS